MAAPADSNPYVGPRPFDREDAPRFFGRVREVRDLVSLIVAQRVVLLYAASGAGKTSLLNAGVLPALEAESSADVLPVARVRSDQPPASGNVFAGGLVASLAEETPDGARLVDILARRPRTADRQLRVLVIDQFEELFTAYPEHWQERLGLFDELREALDSDPALRIVLSIREDFVAQLDPFVLALPGGFRTRVRLERLDRVSALAAVRNPVADTARAFAPGAAEALVTDLLRFQVETGSDGPMEVEGEFVEPVQLQVACRSLWAKLPADVTEITEEHLGLFGNVDEVLAQLYDESIRAAAAAAHLREGRLRRMVEQTFITSVGTRGTAYRTEHATGGIPNTAIDALENRHLVRAEARAFARWYELTHDRLIGPIRESNARYFGRVRRRQTWYAVGAAAVLLVAALAAAVTLWNLGSEAASGAEASPPTFLGNAPVLAGGGSRPRSFTVGTQISVAGLQNQTLTVRFSEHEGKTGARIFELAPVKRRVTGELANLPLRVSVPVPRNVGSFFVQVQVLDEDGKVLDQSNGSVLTVAASGRVRMPAKPAASPVLAGFEVSTSGTGTVTSKPAGIACGRRCAATYPVGTQVRLTATPGAVARFDGWRGACADAGPTCTLRVLAATQVQAAFVPLEVSPVRSRSCSRVEYHGRGPVDALIVSDLPLNGSRANEMRAAGDTIRAVIARSHWRAGRVNVAYQSCDDRSGAGGGPQLATCKRNAAAYAANLSVVAVTGTFDDRCAQAELQQLASSAAGELALVSPGVSELCLTDTTRLCRLKPTDGYRPYSNFVRVVPNNVDQAVALAEFARAKGIKCAGVIDDGSHDGAMLARVFNMIGRSLGVVCTAGSWSPGASDYRGVMTFLKDKQVDAVFAAGEAGPGAGRMIRDKVAVLGPNSGAVKLVAPASLLTNSVVREAGEQNVAGMIVGSIFSGAQASTGSSKGAPAARHPSARYAAAAAELVLAAVAKAGRDRAAVANALRGASVTAGALGPFRIDHGDPAPLRSMGTSTREPFGIQIATAAGTTLRPTTIVRPLDCLVRAALDATTDTADVPAGCR